MENIITKLSQQLSENLAVANEIWIAVALINDEGFDAIQRSTPAGTIQHYLVGIDLPTTVTVLNTMKKLLKPGSFEAAICKAENGIFHPKLYILRSQDKYRAYIGSANLTNGGLSNNAELSIMVDEQVTCKQLVDWFNQLYANSYPLTAENINSYTKRYEASIKNKDTEIRLPAVTLKKRVIDIFGEIDFTTRYFKKEDHLAFRQELWTDNSKEAIKERYNASKTFHALHKKIYPEFGKRGLRKLFPNKPPHVVSMYAHFEGRTSQELNAMWLSYGKSPDEIKEYHKLFPAIGKNDEDDLQSFINHARLQIRIELKSIGIWILFGKKNGGSAFDRHYFKTRMQELGYRNDFYNMIKELPPEYWIIVSQNKKYINEFKSTESLHEFCKKDNEKYYFIIGRDYQITDDEMSEATLPETVLNEFIRLYPIYEKMRHYL